MEVQVTKVSSKGQVVIPAEIKKALGIKKGDRLLALALNDAILFVKVPKASFLEMARPIWEKARELGLTEEKVSALIEEAKAKSGPR